MTYIPNSIQARDIASLVHMQTNLRKHQTEGPVVVTRGEGCRVFDDSGRERERPGGHGADRQRDVDLRRTAAVREHRLRDPPDVVHSREGRPHRLERRWGERRSGAHVDLLLVGDALRQDPVDLLLDLLGLRLLGQRAEVVAHLPAKRGDGENGQRPQPPERDGGGPAAHERAEARRWTVLAVSLPRPRRPIRTADGPGP